MAEGSYYPALSMIPLLYADDAESSCLGFHSVTVYLQIVRRLLVNRFLLVCCKHQIHSTSPSSSDLSYASDI